MRAKLGEEDGDAEPDRHGDHHGDGRGHQCAVDRRQGAEFLGDRVPRLCRRESRSRMPGRPAASRSPEQAMTPLRISSTARRRQASVRGRPVLQSQRGQRWRAGVSRARWTRLSTASPPRSFLLAALAQITRRSDGPSVTRRRRTPRPARTRRGAPSPASCRASLSYERLAARRP